MKKFAARALTQDGLAAFAAYIAAGANSATAPPTHLLTDAKYSVEYAPRFEVRPRKFASKFEMGMEVATAIGKDALDAAFSEPALWAGLSLQFHEATMPKKEGVWFVGTQSRHIITKIPGRNQDQSHRHLVKGAAIAVSRFGPDARVLMGGASEQSKIEEQIMSRKSDTGLASSPQVVRVANQLYFDADKGSVRKGAKGTGGGSIMRLIEVLAQFDVNYDVSSLSADSIVGLLPQREFERFIKPASMS